MCLVTHDCDDEKRDIFKSTDMLSSMGNKTKSCRWDFLQENTQEAKRLTNLLGLAPPVARVLANRGYSRQDLELESFINPLLSSLHDPFLLKDMDKAVVRVMIAAENGQRIVVYGDYDTDGATATAVLIKTFEFLGIPAGYYMPHRLEEGYGINSGSIDKLAESGVGLIISVDNGISAVSQIAHARTLGIDVVVTDHHQPGRQLPEACAVVDPNRADCAYPNKHLTGVGIAFKLAHALLKKRHVHARDAAPFLRSMLDLVAIGTIADVAPLTGENRVLVKHGLNQIMSSENAGVQALKKTLEMGGTRITAQKVAFQIAPRLNAAGRTDHAGICVELLTTRDPSLASRIAASLESFNRERRKLETRIFEHSMSLLDSQTDLANDPIVVISGPDWHIGVIGIVASKITEVCGRPAIVISEQKNIAKGSARSIRNFNIHDALSACRMHLTNFGGHPGAAGLQLEPQNIPKLRQAINEYARQILHKEDMTPSLTIDTTVENHELEPDVLNGLALLEPCGSCNPTPIFAMRKLKLLQPPQIVGNNHLKLLLSADGRKYYAIGFNLGSYAAQLAANSGANIDAAFAPTINTYYAPGRLELDIKDIKIGAPNR
ncbi:MAG: single-stranded-DNA-specific exonuclease RecJ [bacterium]